ncbi:hypothetical protein [Clostridium felsineum]|uniref:Uncharacterized protein n=1 Tax=Clostridium felsineum TaxID=36839 RepID=A0A1S8LD54_9CLOT|nr:hypothetical protein [Clostridium felsineum]URZ05866.1 hypothetical protein CLROS_011970 [Clostridium felsineum]URZ10903.1 hypothetical protein CROST_016180 [Clostridium felsineum]
MDNKEILEFMVDEAVSDLKEINYDKDLFVIKFHYNFDEYEMKAAKAFADEECSSKDEKDTWYSEYYMPFLSDIAKDNVEASVEDCADEFSIKAECLVHDCTDEKNKFSEALVIFSEGNKSFDIDKIAKEIGF